MNVQIATQQPPTSAKVILYTSKGQIQLQLWAKQTPLASKNFIQHCLSGYYVNTIFHRLIPGFMIQGGDPSGTGMGGESVYGAPFRDQFHQRLKFTKRGILAMANAGKNTNNSQFFITFGPCQHLNKKHTIFGKVVGETIYNLMGLQSLDTGEQDRPLEPPIIRKTKVIDHPFTDLKAKEIEQKEKQALLIKQQASKNNNQQTNNERQVKIKKQELKKLKNKKKLTFDDEEQGDEIGVKVVSSHEVLYKKDPGLSNKIGVTKEQLEIKKKEKQKQQQKVINLKNTIGLTDTSTKNNEEGYRQVQKQMQKKIHQFDKSTVNYGNGSATIASSNQQTNDPTLNYVKRFNPTTNKYELVFQDQLDKQREEREKEQELQRKAKQQQEISDQKLRQVREMQINQYNLLKAEQLNFKRVKEGSLKEKRKQIINEEKKLLSNLQRHRYEFKQKQKINQHQGELAKKLLDFTSRLKAVAKTNLPQNIQPVKNDDNNNQEKQQITSNIPVVKSKLSWMNHKLKFHVDSTNAYSLQEKANRVNKGNEDEDDGGLKMEVDYNYDEDNQRQQNIDDLLKEL